MKNLSKFLLIIIIGFGTVGGCGGGNGEGDEIIGGDDFAGEQNCTDMIDNDGDTEVDCDDIDCVLDPSCTTCEENLEILCDKEYVVPILVVRVSDDDGGRRANISAFEVQQWVDEANDIFLSSQIQFEFIPAETGPHWIDINNTDMNNVAGEFPGDPIWENSKNLGNQIAEEHPDKIVIFFRHGPGDFPTGGGFSSTQYDFIVMPGFQHTELCGEQNIVLFAHEIGHYLGLFHTFTQDLATINDAIDFYIESGRNPNVFDGDGLADTSPDALIREIDCTSATTVNLDGDIFELLRDNNMSYYYNNGIQKTHTIQQINILELWLDIRFPFLN